MPEVCHGLSCLFGSYLKDTLLSQNHLTVQTAGLFKHVLLEFLCPSSSILSDGYNHILCFALSMQALQGRDHP